MWRREDPTQVNERHCGAWRCRGQEKRQNDAPVKNGLLKGRPAGASMHSPGCGGVILQRRDDERHPAGDGHPQKEQGEEGGGRWESSVLLEEPNGRRCACWARQGEPCCGGKAVGKGRRAAGGAQQRAEHSDGCSLQRCWHSGQRGTFPQAVHLRRGREGCEVGAGLVCQGWRAGLGSVGSPV